MYTCKYCAKTPANVKHAIPLMYATEKLVEKRTSRAHDAGTPDRNLQFHINLMNNLYTQLTEYHDMQAAAKLLGIDSEYKSHRFRYFEFDSSRLRWLRQSTTDASCIHIGRDTVVRRERPADWTRRTQRDMQNLEYVFVAPLLT